MIDNFTTATGEKVHFLTRECIIDLHEILSNNTHLLENMDPVEPRGIKSISLLDSAVGRQTTGYGQYYKYPDCFSNAATITYGIIKNHAFHNGNKRAGLLALIKHLYVNGYVISPELNSNELYDIMIAIADSKLSDFHFKHKKKYIFYNKDAKNWDTDIEVDFLSKWIKKNSRPKTNTIKGDLKVSVLKNLLNNKNISVDQDGSTLKVFIEKENKFLGVIPLGSRKLNVKQYALGKNKSYIGKGTLAILRRDFNLTKAEGIDDTFFYDDEAFLDSEIKAYKQIIYRLSKT